MVQQVEQALRNQRADARGSLTELVDADQDAGAYQLFRQGRSNADGMAHHQVALQLPGIGGRDADILQCPDPGRQPINDPVLTHQAVDERARRRKPAFGGGADHDALAVARDRHHIGGTQ